MEALQLQRVLPISIPICVAQNCVFIPSTATPLSRVAIARPPLNLNTRKSLSLSSTASSPTTTVTVTVRAGWFLGLAGTENKKMSLPDTVKAGDPVLHEPAQELDPNEIRSERVQKIIDDMIRVMRKAPGVGLAAPQIGIPFRIIVLEDTKEYISYAPKEEIKAQDRRPFDLLFS